MGPVTAARRRRPAARPRANGRPKPRTRPKARRSGDRFWRGRRVLVTGATGLIGSWLVKALLSRGAAVTALIYDEEPQSELYRSGDIKRVSVVHGALQDFTSVERAINEHDIGTVFHLGAQTIVGTARRFPMPTFESNIRGTYHVLEACRIHSKLVQGVVVASSDKAYGAKKELPYTEDMSLEGRQPYEVSKTCQDLLARSYHRTYGLPAAVARCGNVIGGGDLHWSRIVPGTIRSFLRGERPVIRSDGRFKRDYIYVKDIARAYMRLGEALRDKRFHGSAFNFAAERPFTVLEVVRAIAREMKTGHLRPDVRNEAVGEIRDQYLSCARARRRLGWKHEYSLAEALRETVRWYRAYYGDGE